MKLTRAIHFVSLAEFDVEHGSVLRHQYPFQLKSKDEKCHQRNEDGTYFTLEFENPVGCGDEIAKIHKAQMDFEINCFETEAKVESLKFPNENCSIKIEREDFYFVKICGKNHNEKIRIDEKTELKKEFLLVRLDETKFLFSVENDWIKFYLIVNKIKSDLADKSLDDHQIEPFRLYFVSIVKEKKSAKFERGSRRYALSIATPFLWFANLKGLLRIAMESIIENDENEQTVLKKLYHAMFLCETPGFLFHKFELNGELFFKWENKMYPINFGSSNRFQAEKIGISVLKKRFGTSLATILIAVLLEKRILFIGFKCPTTQLCRIVLSACLLAMPLNADILSLTFPYVDLFYIDQLKKLKSYIVGSNNPIFEQKEDMWDLVANVEEGTLAKSKDFAANVASTDFQFFAKTVLSKFAYLRMRSESIKNAEKCLCNILEV
ncbi:hypothetical protein MHBO_001882 [Bonamia ostreae]|uniref:UDENN domain-containing protein n=1 Tax=Bonamia ostreae TaxID=126728 RepID=A0ABV2AKK2_9EUKA